MTILNGQKLANTILAKLKKDIKAIGSPPHLAVVLVGNNPASLKYIDMKRAMAQKIGIKTTLHHFSANTSQKTIISLIKGLNEDRSINGILVQLPLPPNFDTNAIVNTINPTKDVDGLTGKNLGALFQSDETVSISASAMAIITLLEKYKLNFEGKHVVIVNNTPLVGLPLTALFNNRLV